MSEQVLRIQLKTTMMADYKCLNFSRSNRMVQIAGNIIMCIVSPLRIAATFFSPEAWHASHFKPVSAGRAWLQGRIA